MVNGIKYATDASPQINSIIETTPIDNDGNITTIDMVIDATNAANDKTKCILSTFDKTTPINGQPTTSPKVNIVQAAAACSRFPWCSLAQHAL